ncbi:hypothetical protein PN36_06655 [Candidatus Thiomargarita nelsonii]|uniref:PIN domain-containing protein n=1 Tax=Candidatus Thiomargarita nelsonii TaxID=1003181 RepID=A0A4E0QRL3_9GAMM|nr:hypothetical protein PN36_06655 [Candidatus Thiomargarita nelsonii]
MKDENKKYLLDTNHCVYILNAKRKPESKQSEMEKNTVKAASYCLDSFIHLSKRRVRPTHQFKPNIAVRRTHPTLANPCR